MFFFRTYINLKLKDPHNIYINIKDRDSFLHS